MGSTQKDTDCDGVNELLKLSKKKSSTHSFKVNEKQRVNRTAEVSSHEI